MNSKALFISDKRYVNSEILGGVQLCSREYIKYLNLSGFELQKFYVEPLINFCTKVKIKAGVDVYEHYPIKKYLKEIVSTINSDGIKLVFFNQLSLAFWTSAIKPRVHADVKFIGLSHGNESGDYIHDISRQSTPTKLQTWKLGKLLTNELKLFSEMLDGLIVLSELEIAINQWLGANNILFLPRILSPNFVTWQPSAINAGFVGTLDHLPNRLGIEQLCEELQSLNFKYQLTLVGGPEYLGRQLSAKYSFIRYKGPINDNELAEEVQKWSVFLNPVFWYARGASTKLTQAINKGLPCLTTPAGRRGYVFSNGSIVTTDNTPKTFAKTLTKILDEPSEIAKLKKAAEENALEFDTKLYVDQLTQFIYQIER